MVYDSWKIDHAYNAKLPFLFPYLDPELFRLESSGELRSFCSAINRSAALTKRIAALAKRMGNIGPRSSLFSISKDNKSFSD